MKIKAGAYPEEKNIDKWVGFLKNGNVNIVFLWRYAAYCRDIIKAKNIADIGLRDTAEQKRLYDLYKAGKGNVAAAPGTSWHEYGFAIDLNRYKTNADGTGQYHGTINEDYYNWLAGKPETLNKYGLIHTVKGEIWHIQPIETKGVSDKKGFADADDYLRNDYKEPVVAVDSHVSEINNLNQRITELTNENGRLEKDNADLNAKIVWLETKLAESDASILSLSNEKAIIKKALQDTLDINSEHLKDCIEIAQENMILKTKVEKLEKQIADTVIPDPVMYDISNATLGELIGAIWNLIKGIKKESEEK